MILEYNQIIFHKAVPIEEDKEVIIKRVINIIQFSQYQYLMKNYVHFFMMNI
jgi:hypothetical protein